MSGLVGALGEAWAELRHHKLRVFLSLIGISVSVAALTTIVAVFELQQQLQAEIADREGGRQATISVAASSKTGASVDTDELDEQVTQAAQRFAFSHTSRVIRYQLTTRIQTSQWVEPLNIDLIDVDYGTMHRVDLSEGRWFRDGDEQLLAPPMVVSFALWQEVLGEAPLTAHPVITLTGDLAGTYQVVGVQPPQYVGDTEKRVTLLYDTYRARVDQLPPDVSLTWEMWVTQEAVAEIGPNLAADIRSRVGDDIQVDVNRADWGSRPDAQAALAVAQLISGVIGAIVLLLGGLGLVNIQLVAMRQRIREIGVRRSFGATAGRIFTSVLLESVVATAVAGMIGIVLVIVLMRSPLVLQFFGQLQDPPPFPANAAIIGLACSVLIGALAGFLPALTATRVKVIDALRF